MGSPAVDYSANAADSAHADVASALHLRHIAFRPILYMVLLNEPITVDEVSTSVAVDRPRGKSADVQGMTCELLRWAVVCHSHSSPCFADTEYICEPLAACLTG
jgi:hypothetical protein